MRVSLFIALMLVSIPVLAQTFIDQIDEGFALVCSNDSGEWICEPISIEQIRELGFTDVEGMVLVEPPEPEVKK